MIDDPRMDPADLRSASFPGSFRRYEARAVDEFLATVAERVAETNTLVDDLQRQLFEARSEALKASAADAAADAPDLRHLSDDELVRLVGDETAHVLTTARRAAEEIRTKAEEAAARMIRETTAEANRMTEDAEERVVELTAEAESARDIAVAAAEEEADRIRSEATAEAERVGADAAEAAERLVAEATEKAAAVAEESEAARAAAEEEAAGIITEARDEGARMLEEAKDIRRQILADLRRRRDLGRAQVERLAIGRDSLLAAYDDVRANLDEITARLTDVLPDPSAEVEPIPEIPDLDEETGGADRDVSGFTGIVGAKPSGDDEADADAEAESAAGDVSVDDTVRTADEELAAVDEADVAEGEPPGAGVDETEGDESDVEETDDAGSVVEPASSADARDVDADEPADADPVADAAADAPPTGAGDAEPGEESAPTLEDASAEASEEGGVDALFARIRAERAESVARAQEILAVDRSTAEPALEAEPPAAEGSDTEAAADTPTDGDGDVDAGDVERVPAALLAAGPVWEHRTETVTGLDKKLSRALKRVLSDEQNEVLDALRRTESTAADDLLPPLDDHVAAYAGAARPHLDAAAGAGAGQVDADAVVDAADIALTLGRTLVEPFRRRIERTAADVAGDADELDERLRAVYREWKVEHIGPASRDAMLDAYAHGQHEAAPEGATLRWLIDPAQGPCPDAQDNALAGAVTKGTTFPTGDACPQAHPGCLCLLAVD